MKPNLEVTEQQRELLVDQFRRYLEIAPLYDGRRFSFGNNLGVPIAFDVKVRAV